METEIIERLGQSAMPAIRIRKGRGSIWQRKVVEVVGALLLRGQRNHRNGKALVIFNDGPEFLGFAGPGYEDQHVVLRHHAEVAWLASAGCMKNAGVPVEAMVAAILRPMWPLLPMPLTITRPRDAMTTSTAFSNKVCSNAAPSVGLALGSVRPAEMGRGAASPRPLFAGGDHDPN